MTPVGSTVGSRRRTSTSNLPKRPALMGGFEPGDADAALRLAAVVVELALDGRWAPDELVPGHSSAIPTSGAFRRAACRIAVRDPRLLSLPPAVGAETVLRLVQALGPASEVSVWVGSSREPRAFIAAHRDEPTRATRAAARAAIEDGNGPASATIRATAILAWEIRRGALVVRVADRRDPPPDELLEDAAAAIGLLLEKEALLERSVARERELVESAERQLVRLGLDLHDGPIQDLAAAATSLHLLRRRAVAGQAETRQLETIAQALTAVTAAYEGLRRRAHSATGPGFARTQLKHIVEREARLLADQSEIDVRLDVSGSYADLTPSQRIALARIVQESLSNAREHSGATSVRVSLRRAGGRIRVDVEDDGGGFDVDRALARAARSGRLGLVGMSERARLLGGTLDIESRLGDGTRVSVVLPEWSPLEPAAVPDGASAHAG